MPYVKKFRRVRKFTDSEKHDIVKRYSNKELLRNIARIHNTNIATVSDIAIRQYGQPKRQRGPQKDFNESV
jgi:transposase-like protein